MSQRPWPVPYCATQVMKENRLCGGEEGNVGLTITWGLYPVPENNGFILQHVDIKDDPGEHYQDYTEVWPVTNGVIGIRSRRDPEWAPNTDHFCVEKSQLGDDGRRTYTATAWFVEGDMKEADRRNLTKSRQVSTAGSLRHKVGELDENDAWNGTKHPSLDRVVTIKEGAVQVACTINHPGRRNTRCRGACSRCQR